MKYYIILLIIGFIHDSPTEADGKISKYVKSRSNKGITYFFLANFLRTCDLNQKKVLIFDYYYKEDTFRALADMQPNISVSQFTNSWKWDQLRRYQWSNLKVDAVFLTINITASWHMIDWFLFGWRFNRDSIVYILPVPLNDCDSYELILEYVMRFYFPAAYYICLMNNEVTQVYTYDPYGDTEPPYWGKIRQSINWGKNWTFYNREYPNDMSELCPGFNFKRTDSNELQYVVLSLHRAFVDAPTLKNNVLYDDGLEPNLYEPYDEIALNLKKLLKIQFQYYIIDTQGVSFPLDLTYNEESMIDAEVFLRVLVSPTDICSFFFPAHYESYQILSHNQDVMTPLEKTASFYGMWTLLSLILILSITFIVIWLTIKQPGLGTFDVVRLLFNRGIFVLINTRPLTIFFSVIILYFLVIYVTFSEHLAEFLTQVQQRPKIETLDDLKDSRVEKIYSFEFEYDTDQEFDILREKTKRIYSQEECEIILNETNSVCIAPSSVLQMIFLENKNSSEICHISKTELSPTILTSTSRPGFPLFEKFNLAIMTFFESALVHREFQRKWDRLMETMKRRIASNTISYRKITLGDLYFAFVLLIIGNCAGIVCFLCELYLKNISNFCRKRYHLKHKKIVRIKVQPY